MPRCSLTHTQNQLTFVRGISFGSDTGLRESAISVSGSAGLSGKLWDKKRHQPFRRVHKIRSTQTTTTTTTTNKQTHTHQKQKQELMRKNCGHQMCRNSSQNHQLQSIDKNSCTVRFQWHNHAITVCQQRQQTNLALERKMNAKLLFSRTSWKAKANKTKSWLGWSIHRITNKF